MEAPIPWPVNENLPFLGQEVAQQLLRKDFCVVQSLLSPEVAAEALNLAKKLSFKRLVKELEVCYLGRDIGSEKVAWLPPEDPRSQVTTPLESCDRMLSSWLQDSTWNVRILASCPTDARTAWCGCPAAARQTDRRCYENKRSSMRGL